MSSEFASERNLPYQVQAFIDLSLSGDTKQIRAAEIERAKAHGSIGSIVLNCYLLSENKLGGKVIDPLSLEVVDTKSYFSSTKGLKGYSNLLAVKPSFLPFGGSDTTVKAVFFYNNDSSSRHPIVQTTLVDRKRLSEELPKHFNGKIFLLDNKIIRLDEDGTTNLLITLSNRKGRLPVTAAGKKLQLPGEFYKTERSQFEFLPRLSRVCDVDDALRVLNFIHAQNIFQPERPVYLQMEGAFSASSGGQSGAMRQRQELRQEMHLLAEQEMLPLMRQQQRVHPKTIMKSKILGMNNQELRKFLRDLGNS